MVNEFKQGPTTKYTWILLTTDAKGRKILNHPVVIIEQGENRVILDRSRLDKPLIVLKKHRKIGREMTYEELWEN